MLPKCVWKNLELSKKNVDTIKTLFLIRGKFVNSWSAWFVAMNFFVSVYDVATNHYAWLAFRGFSSFLCIFLLFIFLFLLE